MIVMRDHLTSFDTDNYDGDLELALTARALSRRAAWIGLLLCVFGMAAVVVGMKYAHKAGLFQ